MSAVTTLAVTIAAAAGAVALYRFAEKRTRPLRQAIDEIRNASQRNASGGVIDYERDPESGVYKPKTPGRN